MAAVELLITFEVSAGAKDLNIEILGTWRYCVLFSRVEQVQGLKFL